MAGLGDFFKNIPTETLQQLGQAPETLGKGLLGAKLQQKQDIKQQELIKANVAQKRESSLASLISSGRFSVQDVKAGQLQEGAITDPNVLGIFGLKPGQAIVPMQKQIDPLIGLKGLKLQTEIQKNLASLENTASLITTRDEATKKQLFKTQLTDLSRLTQQFTDIPEESKPLIMSALKTIGVDVKESDFKKGKSTLLNNKVTRFLSAGLIKAPGQALQLGSVPLVQPIVADEANDTITAINTSIDRLRKLQK